MKAEGRHWIGGDAVRQPGGPSFHAIDPTTGGVIGPAFPDASPAEIDRAMKLAAEAFPAVAAVPRERRARFLETIAAELDRLGDAWLDAAHLETGLPLARLQGERGRTLNQLRMFAGVVRDGDYLDLCIERADPERKPLPKPDLRRINRPLGPVVVFGAGNFPLAFSVAGGDTASALAAGCPVVVKGHPAHPATSELAGSAIVAAADACGLPPGVFALLHGRTNEVGERLVRHARTAAVGFTGSLAGGRALFDIAAARPSPIPVYAEMGSLNPVFLLPRAVEMRGPKIAEGLAASCLGSMGQLCTKPGLIVLRDSPEAEECVAELRRRILAATPGAMLTPGMAANFARGTARAAATGAMTSGMTAPLTAGSESPSGPATCLGTPALFEVDVRAFLAHPELREEIFGPAAVVVRCRDDFDLLEVAEHLPGALAAAVHHADPAEAVAYADLIEQVARRAGRVVFNGYPTGVEVTAAMMHGGPYPATTASAFTSVGADAIKRWLRPVAFQDAPVAILPTELRG